MASHDARNLSVRTNHSPLATKLMAPVINPRDNPTFAPGEWDAGVRPSLSIILADVHLFQRRTCPGQLDLGAQKHIVVLVSLDGATALHCRGGEHNARTGEITILRNYFDQCHLQPKTGRRHMGTCLSVHRRRTDIAGTERASPSGSSSANFEGEAQELHRGNSRVCDAQEGFPPAVEAGFLGSPPSEQILPKVSDWAPGGRRQGVLFPGRQN